MTHFDISQWVDFARGVTRDADSAAMDAHVGSGCARCRRTLDLVTRIVRSARDESRYQPPEHVVRCARAISALLSPQRSRSSRLVARLVYDSRRDPVPAGIRAGDRVSRHALYEAGNFSVEVRLEQEKGSSLATLVGQLTDRQDPARAMPERPVLLMARKEIIAHTVYNRFGEFQMDYPPAPDLRLSVALDSPDKRLDLSLKLLVAEMAKSPALPCRRCRRSLAGKRE